MAERTRFRAYLIFCAICATIVYPFVAHCKFEIQLGVIRNKNSSRNCDINILIKGCWAPSGWLSAFRPDPLYANGVIDFAGSGVVHMTGGICALTGKEILLYLPWSY